MHGRHQIDREFFSLLKIIERDLPMHGQRPGVSPGLAKLLRASAEELAGCDLQTRDARDAALKLATLALYLVYQLDDAIL